MALMITVDEQGTMKLPEEVRRQLGLHGRSALAVEVRDEGVLLRRMGEVPAEQTWAARDMSRTFLDELITRANEINNDGRDVTSDELAAWLDDGEAKGLLRRVPVD